MVHHDMGLAGQHQLASAGAQVLAHGYLANGQGHAVPGGPMRGRVAAGVVAHARWPAHARIHKGAVKPYAALGKRVDIRGANKRMAIACQVVGAQLVRHYEKYVLGLAHRSEEHTSELQSLMRISYAVFCLKKKKKKTMK